MPTKLQQKKELLEKANYANDVLFKTIEAKCALEVLLDIGAFDHNSKKQIVDAIGKLDNLEVCLMQVRDKYYNDAKELN